MDRRPSLSHIQPPDVYLTPRCAWTGNHQPYLCPNGGLNVDPCGGEGGSGGVVLPIRTVVVEQTEGWGWHRQTC